MAITAANLTSGTTLNVSSVATASISPSANKLVIVSVASASIATTNAPTVTGAGGTWVQIGNKLNAANNGRVTLFRDLSASPGTGALTIDFAAQSQSNISWSIDQLGGIDVTGTHGSGAIVQFQSNTANATNTGLTVTLNTLASANNAALGYLKINSANAVTVGSGFTQLSNATNTSLRSVAEWELNNTAVAWTWASQNAVSTAAAIEIKAAAGAGVPFSTNIWPLPFGKDYSNTANFDGGVNAFLPGLIQYQIKLPLLGAPFSAISYIDKFQLPRNSSLYNPVAIAPPFLGLSLPVSFDTKRYTDFSFGPANPNLYSQPAAINPFVNIWLSR